MVESNPGPKLSDAMTVAPTWHGFTVEELFVVAFISVSTLLSVQLLNVHLKLNFCGLPLHWACFFIALIGATVFMVLFKWCKRRGVREQSPQSDQTAGSESSENQK